MDIDFIVLKKLEPYFNVINDLMRQLYSIVI